MLAVCVTVKINPVTIKYNIYNNKYYYENQLVNNYNPGHN